MGSAVLTFTLEQIFMPVLQTSGMFSAMERITQVQRASGNIIS